HHIGHRRGVLVVHLRADLGAAPASDRSHRSQPARLAAAAAHPERSQSARAGDARHARQRGAVSADRLVRPVLTHPHRPRPCALTAQARFWSASDGNCGLTRAGRAGEARAQIRLSLQARQAALGTAVARLLVQNNESEEQTAQQVQEIYASVQRQVYWFLAATLAAIVATSLY